MRFARVLGALIISTDIDFLVYGRYVRPDMQQISGKELSFYRSFQNKRALNRGRKRVDYEYMKNNCLMEIQSITLLSQQFSELWYFFSDQSYITHILCILIIHIIVKFKDYHNQKCRQRNATKLTTLTTLY